MVNLCTVTIENHSTVYFYHFDALYHGVVIHYAKKATIRQVTTMLATSKDVLLPGHNHFGTRAIIKVLGNQYRWLAGGYDLEIGHF